jgi:hypothetical protein
MKKIILLGLLFCLMPIVFAASINDSIVQSLGLNTNITFNVTRHYDQLTVDSAFILFEGYRATDGATETLTFNITESNGDYYVNSSQEDLPHITTTSNTQKIINSGLTNTLNVTLVVDVMDCNGIVNVSKGSTVLSTTCASNSLTATVEVANGDNTITINYLSNDAQLNESCYKWITGLQAIAAIVGLMVLVIVVVAIYAGFRGNNIFAEMDLKTLGIGVMGLVVLAISAAVVIIALSKICAV